MTEKVLVFEWEKSTKRTERYREVPSNGGAICGTLYVQRWALPGGGIPQRIKVLLILDDDGDDVGDLAGEGYDVPGGPDGTVPF